MLRRVKPSACENFCRKNPPSSIKRRFATVEKKRKESKSSPEIIEAASDARRNRFTKYYETHTVSENDVPNVDTPHDEPPPVVEEPPQPVHEEEEETAPEIEHEQDEVRIEISEPVALERKPTCEASEPAFPASQNPPATGDPRLIFPILPETRVFEPYTKKVKKTLHRKKPEKRARTPTHNRGFLTLEQLEQSKSPFRNRVQNPMNYSRHVHFSFDSDDMNQFEMCQPRIVRSPEKPVVEEKKETPKFSPRKKLVDTAEFVQVEGELMKQETIYRSNREAIAECIRARVGDPLQREKMLTTVKLNPSAHFILLLVEPLRMVEGVYRVVSSDKAQRLCGDVKPEITIGEVSGLWRYNPSTKNFVPQAERSFTALTDAVSVVL